MVDASKGDITAINVYLSNFPIYTQIGYSQHDGTYLTSAQYDESYYWAYDFYEYKFNYLHKAMASSYVIPVASVV